MSLNRKARKPVILIRRSSPGLLAASFGFLRQFPCLSHCPKLLVSRHHGLIFQTPHNSFCGAFSSFFSCDPLCSLLFVDPVACLSLVLLSLASLGIGFCNGKPFSRSLFSRKTPPRPPTASRTSTSLSAQTSRRTRRPRTPLLRGLTRVFASTC